MSDTYQESVAAAVPVVLDKASGMAITALVLGILGFCCCGCMTGLPALVLGYLENQKINRGQSSEKGKWMVIVAIVLGIISLVVFCIQIIWIGFFGGLGFLQGLANQIH